MSFGLTRFKELKNSHKELKETQNYFPYIIVGKTTMAALAALKLAKELGKDKVCLLTDSEISEAGLYHEWKSSLPVVLNELQRKRLIEKYPLLVMKKVEQQPLFYKEGKIHPFGGRARPYKLLEFEDHFLQDLYQLDFSTLFTAEDFELLSEIQRVKYIANIESHDVEDLISPSHYKIHTGDYECFLSEHLWWMDNPQNLANFINEEQQEVLLGEENIANIAHLTSYAAVVVNLEIEQEIYSQDQMLYIPQSATHDHGHYMVFFSAYNQVNQRQSLSALILLAESEITSEELAKKIRAMRRSIERVIENFPKEVLSERIRYCDHMFYDLPVEIRESLSLWWGAKILS